MTKIADALILTMTRRVRLVDWQYLGLIEREWALYDKLSSEYDRLLLVSYGDCQDEPLAKEHCPGAHLICNHEGLAPEQFEHEAPARIAKALADASSVVVKTNQMEGGTLACAIAKELCANDKHAPLIARGGYIFSRFVAEREGAGSRAALAAATEESRVCAAAQAIICSTPQMADDLSWRHSIERDRFHVVPNYIIERSRPGTVERSTTEVLYAGQLVERKQVDLLIEAVSRLKLDAHLSIIGDGPELASLQALARDRGVRATFEPRLAHAELRDRLARCAVYAQASRLEGHPKTILEAMAEGCVVVGVNAPGTREVVHHGSTGLLAEQSAESLASALTQALTDQTLRNQLASAAQDWALRNVSLDRIIELERGAHKAAIKSPLVDSQANQRAARPPVQFDPSLLDAPLATQVQNFANAIGGFWNRLDRTEGARFLMALDEPLYQLQGHAAIAANQGLHPKHDLTGYHDFFCDRIAEGQRVLDLGSGVGALAVAIAQRSGARVTGMDFEPKNVAQAQSRAKDAGVDHLARFELGDITTDTASSEHDTIVLSNVLEHLQDRSALLARWRETYRCEHFLIRVPMFQRDWRVPWKKHLGVEWRLDDTHETEYLEDELISDLREAGLEVREWITRWGEFWVHAVGAH